MYTMFSALLSLPRDRSEARLVADALDGVARALREWPVDAWQQLRQRSADGGQTTEPLVERATAGLLQRLLAHVAPLSGDARRKSQALRSAEVTASVLSVLWPDGAVQAGALPVADPERRELAASAA